MRKLPCSLAWVLAVFLFSLQGMALQPSTAGMWWESREITGKINLTDEQAGLLGKIFRDCRKKYLDLNQDLKRDRQDLESMTRIAPGDSSRDETEIRKQKELIAQRLQDMTAVISDMRHRMRECLSEDQQRRLNLLLPVLESKGSGVIKGSDSGKYALPAGEEVYRTGGKVKEPALVKKVNPPYTEEARQAGREGIVLLEAVVGKDGKAYNFRILRSLGYGLDEVAIWTIAEKWKFKAATVDGQPVNYPVQIEVSFIIPKGFENTTLPPSPPFPSW